MSEHPILFPWTEPRWLEQATRWIEAELKRLGLSATGAIEQPHVRPWSTVLRVPTTEGSVFFKANSPAYAHEAVLALALARWRPDCTAAILAADEDRGWMLMRDGGRALRDHIRSAEDLRHWDAVLPLYAGLQRDLARRTEDLLAVGAFDRRLAVLPAQYEGLLADPMIARVDEPDRLTSKQHRRLRGLAPRFAETCRRLAEYGIPETIQHDDFHDANVLVRGGRYTIFDWGDACVCHPFCTLLVTLRSVAYRLDLEDGAPALVRLGDVYLESWVGYGSLPRLREALVLARRIGMVCRALAWGHLASSLEGPLRDEYAGSAVGWLQDYLEAESEAA